MKEDFLGKNAQRISPLLGECLRKGGYYINKELDNDFDKWNWKLRVDMFYTTGKRISFYSVNRNDAENRINEIDITGIHYIDIRTFKSKAMEELLYLKICSN